MSEKENILNFIKFSNEKQQEKLSQKKKKIKEL